MAGEDGKEGAGTPPRKRWLRLTRGLITTAVLSVIVFFGAILAHAEAVRDEQEWAQAQFDRYHDHLEKTIANYRAGLPAGSPLHEKLDDATSALRGAEAQEGSDVVLARIMLEEGYEFMCEVSAEAFGYPCTVPQGERVEHFYQNPTYLNIAKVLGAFGLGASLLMSVFGDHLKAFVFGKGGKPEGGS